MIKYLRAIICTVAAVLSVFCAVAEASVLQQSVDSLLRDRPVRVGVAVMFRGERICSVRADERFPMMSVFKLHQAIAALDSLGRMSMTLDSTVKITPEMLRPDTYSPMRDRFPQGVVMTIGELLEYSVKLSDNNACDIIFNMFGGPEVVNDYIHRLGIVNTEICWTEADMHVDKNRCKDNYTTPADAAMLLDALASGAMDGKYIPWLCRIMADTVTGADRLAAPLQSTDAVLHHKTGTGFINPDGTVMAVNDIGFVTLPNGDYYVVAVFCADSKESPEVTASIISEISRLTYEYVKSRK